VYAPYVGLRCLGLARVKADITGIGISGQAGYLRIDTQPFCYVSHIMDYREIVGQVTYFVTYRLEHIIAY